MKSLALSLLAGMFVVSTAVADAVTVHMCADPVSGNCTSSEVPQEVSENLDGDSLTDGRMDRDWDRDDRTFEISIDFVDENAADVCMVEARIQVDPLTVYGVGNVTLSGEATVTSGSVYSACTRASAEKAPPSGWPGLTELWKCIVAEDDYLFEAEGDLEMGADAEFTAEVELLQETAVYGARTGDGAVVLTGVRQFVKTGSGSGNCQVDGNVDKDFGGEVTFNVDDDDGCGQFDIDGDTVCESGAQGSDNCSGFYGNNFTQADADDDGYGDVCDGDITGDCIKGGPDLAQVFAHYGDATGNNWCGHGNPCTGGPHDSINDVNGDGVVGAPDLAIISAARLGTIGPSDDGGEDPDPSCGP